MVEDPDQTVADATTKCRWREHPGERRLLIPALAGTTNRRNGNQDRQRIVASDVQSGAEENQSKEETESPVGRQSMPRLASRYGNSIHAPTTH